MMRLAVMVSGSGSNLQALIDAQKAQQLNATINVVICDQPKAQAISRTLAARIPVICVPLAKKASREQWAEQISQLLAAFTPDLIVMAGWMKVMPAAFVERWTPNIINQHPALLPDDGGEFYTLSDGRQIPAIRGAHAVRDALDLGVPVTGCTVHQITPIVDVGPVLAKAEVAVLPNDDQASLHERIKQAERRILVDVINNLAQTVA
ncbi:phosphoribosylglycinamide formyltransferase [Herpetosiphon sp. NSE202]|uniref:phosphoribosylglycinamide formyltransferase n=1 Tax=Herpetosiphon sp. NSE202 TaxID=3351349 RepID=UPI003631FBF2